MLNLSAFGKNDIRGIYGEDVTEEDTEVEIDLKPFVIGIKEAGFAAASYEANNNLLSGVVCDINKNVIVYNMCVSLFVFQCIKFLLITFDL